MTRDEVVQTLMKDPHARDAWHVLSDLLQQDGNPRGELLAIDLALEAQPGDEALTKRHKDYFDAHAAALLGDLLSQVVREGYGAAKWERGYVTELSYVGSPGLGHKRAVKWLVNAICTQPEALTFLRRVDFTLTDLDDPAPLACFKGLFELDLQNTAVKKLDWVEKFQSLRVVNVKGCQLEKGALSAARVEFPKIKFN
ncbi:MAG: hypothetical protein JNM17_31345 [Archangium sp.]|nr:hypothetical protein [Archangium sp.]